MLLQRARKHRGGLDDRAALAIRYLAGQVELGKNPRTDECTEFVVLGDEAVGACAEQIQALSQREGMHTSHSSPDAAVTESGNGGVADDPAEQRRCLDHRYADRTTAASRVDEFIELKLRERRVVVRMAYCPQTFDC
jgi:hypothetical protein